MNDVSIFDHPDAVAVVGMSGRFPAAGDVGEFWRILRDGVEAISFFSDEELLAAGVEASALKDPNYVRAAGVLKDVEFFDASFFGYSPREAEVMDPQHRVFLECAWEALEDAGYDPESYGGRVGVYAGTGMSTYLLFNLLPNRELVELIGPFQAALGNDKDYLATRVSYKLNLKGPSVTVQTACSTSLVAVCTASRSLLTGECDMALAGGVTVRLPHRAGYLYQPEGILSPDGHCRAFDAGAQGTVTGSGAGVVVLKRLADALADGDQIRAVIRGTALNNDGSGKVGYTAPSVEGQAEVIAEALAVAGVRADSIGYVEAHGTGTRLGDPVEIAALTRAFRMSTGAKNYCAVGSVKTNIGHLDMAAGVAGLIKTVLALEHGQLPPSLHFEQPNPEIDFSDGPFYVNEELGEWRSGGTPRRAGVSSFGLGGTNAHVVVEEAPPLAPSDESRPWQLLALSARTESALEAATANLARHLREHPETNLADAAYTLQVGRRSFGHRRVLVARDCEDAALALGERDPRRVFSTTTEDGYRPLAFMFPGQGAQHARMAAGLYEAEPTFRAEVDLCSEVLRPHLGLNLRELLFARAERAGEAAEQLDETFITQPALFVVGYALARLLMSWGVRPEALVGHSIGEYVAACLAGVFSLEDALMLVAARGRLMQQLPRGAMLSVPLSELELEPYLGGGLSLAAVNAPSLCTASGPTDAVAELERQLAAKKLNSRRLHTSHAFHSGLVEPILETFAGQFAGIALRPPQIPYLSNVTGSWITAGEATDPAYWARHLRQTVRFAEGAAELLREPERILVEVGPGQQLSALVRQLPAARGRDIVPTLRHPRDENPDAEFLLKAVGKLWLAGVAFDWTGFHAPERRRRLSLPTYPFERQRHWVEPLKGAAATRAAALHKKADIAEWFYVPSWKRSVPPDFAAPVRAPGEDFSCLVFLDERGFGSRVVEELERVTPNVLTVAAGELFERVGDRRFKLNPGEPGDYDALVSDLRASRQTPTHILHLWNVTREDEATQLEPPGPREPAGFYSLLRLAQALGRQVYRESVNIYAVSNGVHSVVGGEELHPHKAASLGACKVIPQEYPNLVCRSIDFALHGAGAREMAPGQLIAELFAEADDTVVAYRGEYRWVQVFDAVPLTHETAPRIRSGGHYVITGGLGRFGAVIAEHLANRYQAKLTLIDLTKLSSEGRAETSPTGQTETDAAERLRTLRELKDSGAEVEYVAADVAVEARLTDALRRSVERFGEVNGVIHAAGLTGEGAYGTVAETGVETCRAHFGPKVGGLAALAKALRESDPAFFFLTSSLAPVLGGIGLAAAAAADAWMDSLAHHLSRTRETPFVSVNWEGWSTAAEAAGSGEIGKQQSELIITAEEIAEAFERALAVKGVPQLVVSSGDLHARLAQWTGVRKRQATKSAPPADRARQGAGAPALAPRSETEEKIARVWQQSLGVGQIGVTDDFFELGGNSLVGLQILSQLRAEFQVELPLRSFFEARTVEGMACVIESERRQGDAESERLARLLEEIESLPDEEVGRLLAEG